MDPIKVTVQKGDKIIKLDTDIPSPEITIDDGTTDGALKIIGNNIEVSTNNAGNTANLILNPQNDIDVNSKNIIQAKLLQGKTNENLQVESLGTGILNITSAKRIDLTSTDGIKSTAASFTYPHTYSTSHNQTLGITSTYARTCNFNGGIGNPGIINLPEVTASNVGLQFLITNVNADLLQVTANGSQTIVSTFGPFDSTNFFFEGSAINPRELLQYHSHVFTAIQIGASTYGWSMT
jgi:hypothetical protein